MKKISSIKPNTINLNSVKQALNEWRKAKTKQNERIPRALWQQIFALLNHHSESEVRIALNLTPIQIRRGRELYQSEGSWDQPSYGESESIGFCEVKDSSDSSVVSIDEAKASKTVKPSYSPLNESEGKPFNALVSKPAQAFSTATSIVEIYRPDGMLMKIHICTDRFEELLSAFFKGNGQ